MSFKVKDLMINVALMPQAETCTGQTWTGACGGSLFDWAQKAANELSLLKAQLRLAAMRA
jgi:hypothetical protein